MALKRRKTLPVSPHAKEEGNSYDKIFKENLRQSAPLFIRKILGLVDFRLETLPQVRLQTTLEKEPDFLQRVFDAKTPNGRLLQIEFEGSDSTDADWRMAEYAGIGGKIFRSEIDQNLLYFGNGKPKKIKGRIRHTHFTFRYKVHSITDFSFREFLDSDTPEEVVFAILANPDGLNPGNVIQLILQKLVQLKGDSIAIRKFIHQLVMLSKKRNLRNETIKIVKAMEQYKEYEDDILYIFGEEKGMEKGLKKGIEKGLEEGMEKGIEKGLEKGLEEGMEKGKLLKDIIAIRNMLKKEFDAETIAEILESPLEFVLKIKMQLRQESSIVAAFKGKKKINFAHIAEKFEVHPLLVEVLNMEARTR
jgi:hypothetical protein